MVFTGRRYLVCPPWSDIWGTTVTTAQLIYSTIIIIIIIRIHSNTTIETGIAKSGPFSYSDLKPSFKTSPAAPFY